MLLLINESLGYVFLFYFLYISGTVITPVEFLGPVTSLCIDRRGVPLEPTAVDEFHTMLQYILPLNEVVIDFHDTLKSITSGFASFDYYDHGFHPSPLVKVIRIFFMKNN